ncbi:MAG: hypothetical protein HC875_40545 [Anaerolineales bacterium]|nr:hypothetical protein [Anaerolineales bacterium]
MLVLARAIAEASRDGNPANEVTTAGNTISQLGKSDVQSLIQFGDETISINGSNSFAGTWYGAANEIAQGVSDPNITTFVSRTGDRIVGAMQVFNGNNALHVSVMESIESGTGTRLMQTAAQESIKRGFGGQLTFNAVTKDGIRLAEKIGATLIHAGSHSYRLTEEAAKALLNQP